MFFFLMSGEGKTAKSVALFKHSGHGDLHLTNTQSHMRTCTSMHVREHNASGRTGSLKKKKAFRAHSSRVKNDMDFRTI